MTTRWIISALIFLTLTQCKQELLPENYVQWIKNKENGLLLEKKLSSSVYQLQYCPPEYMALISANGNQNFKGEYNKRKKDFQNSLNFTLKLIDLKTNDILKSNLRLKNEEFKRIRYFSEEISSDVYLLTKSDTISCTLSHFERTYNASPGITINLSFEKEIKMDNPIKLIWFDRVFTNQQIEYNVEPIFAKELPHIKL